MKTVAEKLSQYARALHYRDLPSEVVHEVKRRVIDSLGCALGAFHERPVKIARSLALKVPSSDGATILGMDDRSSPETATFVNGTMIRYYDYNDTYLSLEPAHPSDNLSAALVMAETQKRNGKELIAALVVGYEVQCRLCDAASLRARGWDHVIYGSLSTALVAGKLLKLSEEQMLHALGLAGVPNIALRQTRVGELSMWKGCAFANAARNGIFAALLANEGMTGPTPIFEGEMGLWKQVSGPFRLRRMGDSRVRFKILESSIKFYPAEYHAQSAIQAALELRRQVKHSEEISRVEIETFKTAIQIIAGEKEKWAPQSRETADHSLPYCVAVALTDGKVGLEQFSEKRIRDPKLRRLLRRVAVSENSEFTKAYPRANSNLVRIILRGGSSLEKKVSYPRGHAKNPMTDQEVEEKFIALATPLLSRPRIKRILDTLWRLEKISNIRKVLRLFTL